MRSLKILLVDDDSFNQEILNVTLSREGHTVAMASNAPTGVAMAFKLKPEVVLMDVRMPGEFNGYEAIRRLRERPGFKTTIICQSALSVQGIESQDGVEADAYLLKPYKRKELLLLLDRLMSAR